MSTPSEGDNFNPGEGESPPALDSVISTGGAAGNPPHDADGQHTVDTSRRAMDLEQEEEEVERREDEGDSADRRAGGPSLDLDPLLSGHTSILDTTTKHTQAAINREFERLDRGTIT